MIIPSKTKKFGCSSGCLSSQFWCKKEKQRCRVNALPFLFRRSIGKKSVLHCPPKHILNIPFLNCSRLGADNKLFDFPFDAFLEGRGGKLNSKQPSLEVKNKPFRKLLLTPYEGRGKTKKPFSVFQKGDDHGINSVYQKEEMKQQKKQMTLPKERAKYYTSYSKLSEVKLLTIGIASPLRILQWAEKTLPNGKNYGEVLNANTLHHKTFKPQKGGLFCERIFGPLKDFQCACGKIDKSSKLIPTSSLKPEGTFSLPVGTTQQSLKNQENLVSSGSLLTSSDTKGKQSLDLTSPYSVSVNQSLGEIKNEKARRKFCPDCDVEYTWSVIRRYQLGYIKLCSPVTHIWFLKGTPSYLSLLLDMKKRYLQFVTYCSEFLTIEKSSLPVYSIGRNPSLKSLLPSGLGGDEGSLFIKKIKGSVPPLFSAEKGKEILSVNKGESYKAFGEANTWKSSINPVYAFVGSNSTNSLILDNQTEKGEFNFKSQMDLTSPGEKNHLNRKKIMPKKGWHFNRFQDISPKVANEKWDWHFSKKQHMTPIQITKETEQTENKLNPSNPFLLFLLRFGHVQPNANFVNLPFPSSLPPRVGEKELTFLSPAKQSHGVLKNEDNNLPVGGNEATKLGIKVSFAQKTDLNPVKERKGFLKMKANVVGYPAQTLWRGEGDVSLKNVTHLKKLSKKLSMDLYILFLLERMLHKSSLILAIQNTWLFLYKQAFLKAIHEAKVILAPIKLGVESAFPSAKQPPTPYEKSGVRSNSLRPFQQSSPLWGSGKTGLENTLPYADSLSRVSETEKSYKAYGNSKFFPVGSQFYQVAKENMNEVHGEKGQILPGKVLDKLTSLNLSTAKHLKKQGKAQVTIQGKLDLVFKNLKAQYVIHVFQLLENMKYGIVPLHYTQKFLQKNTLKQAYPQSLFATIPSISLPYPAKERGIASPLLPMPYGQNGLKKQLSFAEVKGWGQNQTSKHFGNKSSFVQKNNLQPSEIEKKISEEIENYLLKNTVAIHRFLKKTFLNSFILDLYDTYIIPKNFSAKQPPKGAASPRESGLEASPSSSAEWVKERTNNWSLLQKKNVSVLCLKLISPTKDHEIMKKMPIITTESILSTYEKFLKIQHSPNFNSPFFVFNSFHQKRSYKKRVTCSLLPGEMEMAKGNAIRKQPLAGVKKDKQSLFLSSFSFLPSFFTSISFFSTVSLSPYSCFLQKESNKQMASYPEFIKTTKETKEKMKFDNKKTLYNNVYTLSHRERWDLEKDWQIFTLFTFGTAEYSDLPIYTYQNRLSSLINSEDYMAPISLNPLSTLNPFLAKQPSLPFSPPPLYPKGEEENSKKENGISVAAYSPSFGSDSRRENHWTNQTEPSLKKGEKVEENKGINTVSLSLSSSFYSGAGIVQQLLNELNFYEIKKLDKQNRLILYQLNKSILKLKKQIQIFVYDKSAQIEFKELCKKRDLLIRRTKLVRKLFRKNSNPSSMILTLIPVLPPDLRPIVKMGNQIAASDLNRLYQRVIYRNDRLKKFLKDPATSQSYEMKYAQRLLQEAVDNLLQNGKSGPNSEKDARGRPLKSLSDILKGKQGRFRQFLLGKRVDYSGRSVIVVGPKLKLHECGLPLEMAKELYLPFLLKSILNKNYAKTVVGAKTLIKNHSSLAHELLREIMQVSPVLLNRAPTLHRLGIQAFVPKLIEGRAILLHPLVCSAFNADFDGDQMAVHVPITVEARAEAWKMMLSRNNILSTATGDPLAIPSQDMVLGCYYLTTFSNHGKILRGSGTYFNSLTDVLKMYEQRLIDVHSLVWVKWSYLVENGTDQEDPLEIRISSFGQWQEITSNYHRIYNSNHNLISQYICTTPGRILLNLLIQKIMITP